MNTKKQKEREASLVPYMSDEKNTCAVNKLSLRDEDNRWENSDKFKIMPANEDFVTDFVAAPD